MFSVQRFGGHATGSNHEGKTNQVDRITLLNQKAAEARQQQPIIGSPGPSSSGPKIHPARLAASQALKQSERKLRSSLQGGAKEKTKAKQRYLNRKKDRRKKRKAVEAIHKKKDKPQSVSEDGLSATKEPNIPSSASESSDDHSDPDSDASSDSTASTPSKKDADILTDQDQDTGLNSKEMIESHGGADRDTRHEEPLKLSVVERDAALAEEAAEETRAAEARADAQMDVNQTHDDALTRFPAPRATRQASRQDLAAQGLPEGLAKPQLVHASMTAKVSKNEHHVLNTISDWMKGRLGKQGITEWFAVQTAIVPQLLGQPQSYNLYPDPPLGDVCVSAPTGSGKTLSYVVPIVEVLRLRTHRRLRALILLPTRDLVHQVRDTLTGVSKGTGLSIASLTGQQSFAHEQNVLIRSGEPFRRNIPGLVEERLTAQDQDINQDQKESGQDYFSSNVDIVITTPGRLVDHLDNTPGFTLQHLRFLVIDEADRLLSQSFQEWLPRVLAAINPKDTPLPSTETIMAPAWRTQKLASGPTVPFLHPQKEPSVQKLLFSATLTRDLARIVALNLRRATFVSVEDNELADAGTKEWQDSFALPASLKEHMFVVPSTEKPLQLLQLLFEREERPLHQVLCFTKSLESSSRLCKLIDFFQEAQNLSQRLVVRQYSSELPAGERIALLDQFSSGQVDVLVCSDVMARGIDLPSVRHVVSYDTPTNMANYVHRVGRTARAGRVGDAWTLVEEQEAHHFTLMMRRAQRWSHMDKIRLSKPDPYAAIQDAYLKALGRLESIYSRKKRLQ